MQVSWWLPLGEYWPRLLITAGLIGVVSLLEAISIAKALAEVNGDHVNADQELLGKAASKSSQVKLAIVFQMASLS